MRLVEESCTTEVDYPNLVALGQPIWLALSLILQKLLFFEQNVLRLEVSVSVSQSMNEGNRFEDLFEKGLDQFKWKASVIILLDELIKRSPERFEDQAEVSSMIERVFISYDSFLILLITSVDVLDDFLLDAGRLNIFRHRFYDLNRSIFYLDSIAAASLFPLDHTTEGSLA